MIPVDAKLLAYARVADFPQHAGARRWLDGRLNGPTGGGLPWSSLLEFVRLVSNPRIGTRRSSVPSWRRSEGEPTSCPTPTWPRVAPARPAP